MSHKDTSIEFDDGVTVITGPNNIGKSAVVEAIRCVAENPSSQELIRHGASKAVVTVELGSGETITWERNFNSSLYRIFRDGKEEVYAKIKNNVPEDVRKLLRISPVVTGDDEVNVHIALQKDPIFIPSGSKAAGFFAASTEAYYLVRMQQLLKTKADVKKSRKKEIEVEISELRRLLEYYDPLDEIEEIFSLADKLEADIKKFEKTIPLLSDHTDRLEGLIRERDTLESRKVVLENLQPVPALNPTKDLADTVIILEQLENTLRNLRDKELSLRTLLPLPELNPSEALQDIILSMEELEKDIRRLSNMSSLFLDLDPAPALNPVEGLQFIIDKVESITREEVLFKRFQEVFSNLNVPPELRGLHEISSLEKLIISMEEMEEMVRKGRSDCNQIEEQCYRKRYEVEERLKSIPFCPLCNQPLDVDRFFSAVHVE